MILGFLMFVTGFGMAMWGMYLTYQSKKNFDHVDAVIIQVTHEREQALLHQQDAKRMLDEIHRIRAETQLH